MGSARGAACYGLVLWAGVAAAAPVPVAPPRGDTAVSPSAAKLLRHRAVQRELRMSAAQRAAVGEKVARAPAAAKVLTPGQRARLRQLDRQVRGPAALADPDVETELKLTDAQRRLAADLLKRLDDRTAAYLAIFGNDDADNLKEDVLVFRAAAMKTIERTLTAGQREAWRALLGPPAADLDVIQLWLAVLEEG